MISIPSKIMEHINEMQTKNSRSFNLNIKDLIQGKKNIQQVKKKVLYNEKGCNPVKVLRV